VCRRARAAEAGPASPRGEGERWDRDGALDTWSVSTGDRVIGGERVPAGKAFCHVDDTRE
jgi:hypothetical protein